jgi:hypothetical protein
MDSLNAERDGFTIYTHDELVYTVFHFNNF